MSKRVKVNKVEVLADDWYVLKKTSFDYRRSDGKWQTQTRETYDRGNGAVILLYNKQLETLVLTRQFRYPTFVNGLADGMLIEAAAGQLEDASPERRILMEAEEETGYRLQNVTKIFEAYSSPGSVTEKLHYFIAEYDPDNKVSSGGGLESEGEDIEVLELPFKHCLAMIDNGEIQDAKTIVLIQYAALHIFSS